jgi:hypothetical protein
MVVVQVTRTHCYGPMVRQNVTTALPHLMAAQRRRARDAHILLSHALSNLLSPIRSDLLVSTISQ